MICKFEVGRKYPFRNFPGFHAEVYHIMNLTMWQPVCIYIIRDSDDLQVGRSERSVKGKHFLSSNAGLDILTNEEWETQQK